MEKAMTKADRVFSTPFPNTSAPHAAETSDAELVAAGVEFRNLVDLFNEAKRLSQPNWDAQDAAKHSGRFVGLENEAIFEEMKRIDEQVPLPVPCCDDITDRMDMVERIMALPATTIAGLAAKAEVVRFFNPDAFSEDEGNDDYDSVRPLVEAVLALAGQIAGAVQS
jgi:hypothetical protein